MANIFSPTDRIKQHTQHVHQEVRPWIEGLARLGYAARGVVYLIIGSLAAQAALGGESTADSQNAFHLILAQPFGQALLSIAALGLVGYAVWCFVQAIKDPEHQGSDIKGIGKRIGLFVSGIIHSSLAAAAVGMIVGSGGSNQDNTKGWTAWLMSFPFGIWLVGIIGVLVVGFGLHQLYRAWTVKLDEELDLSQMTSTVREWTIRFGRFGLAARGVVFGIIGGFFIVAAVQTDPNEARGLGEALQTLQQQAFGPWLLGLVAFGLIAYGLYQLATAAYRRIHAT
jgi:hypothetical protein